MDDLLGESTRFGSVLVGWGVDGQNQNNLKGSNVFVVVNTLTQVYYMIALRDSNPRTWQAKLTNIVNITFAGV